MSGLQILFDGSPADTDFYSLFAKVEVEENADLPDAIVLSLPVSLDSGDLTFVSDSRLRPFANVAVVVTPDGGPDQCIFDGYVLSHRVRLDAGTTASRLDVWGQDASVLLGLDEKVREFSGLTDGQIANQVFAEYGIAAGADNTTDDSPAHTDDGHTLMQRGSDIDFLRRLARRSGRWCRVTCDAAPGQRIGIFAPPPVGAAPIATIDLNDPTQGSVAALDFQWDVAAPSSVMARQASLTDSDQQGVSADTDDSGLPPLDQRALQDFAGRNVSVILTASGDAADLPGRARAVLRDAGWFTRCSGTADLSRLNSVLRVGTVVAVQGVGSLLSGPYLVWSVRHTITQLDHRMAFTLVRNAVGPDPGADSGLGGLS